VDDLEDDAFAVRQRDEAAGPRARLLDDRRDRALDQLGGNPDRAFPALVTSVGRFYRGWDTGASVRRGRR
jgi:hypothetical protein